MDFTKLFSLFLVFKYPIIFLIVIIEGPIIMMMSGLLLRLGFASFWPIYFVLMAGDLVGDVFWYTMGYHFAHPLAGRYGKFIGLTPKLVEKTKSVFDNHQQKILFISKITMGLGLPQTTLVVAGMSKMPFKKYIGSLFLGQIIFTGVLLSVGYFFGNLYEKINNNLKILSVVTFIVMISLIIYGVKSYYIKHE